jgi:hypothetical protein
MFETCASWAGRPSQDRSKELTDSLSLVRLLPIGCKTAADDKAIRAKVLDPQYTD